MGEYVVAVAGYLSTGVRCSASFAEVAERQARSAALSAPPGASGEASGADVKLTGAIKTEYGAASARPADLAAWCVARLLAGPGAAAKQRRAHVRRYLNAFNRKVVLLPESTSSLRAGDSLAGAAKVAAFPEGGPAAPMIVFRNGFWMANRFLKRLAAEPKPAPGE